MNLSCVYGPSRQFGKRPRRRLGVAGDVSFEKHTTPTNVNGNDPSLGSTYQYQQPANVSVGCNVNMDDMITAESMLSNTATSTENTNHLDPALFLPSVPNSWPQLDGFDGNDYTLPTSIPDLHNVSLTIPPLATNSTSHRCYHEANEILHSLTLPERARGDVTSATILLNIGQVLEANRTAIDSLNRLLECDCARIRPHLAILYASILSRVLYWYQEAAGYANEDFWSADTTSTSSPTLMSETSTPPPGTGSSSTSTSTPSKCFAITELPFTVGTLDIDEPCVQLAFRNQLIGHEVKKAGILIDKFASLGSDKGVADGDKVLYSTLGAWLKSDHSKTMRIFRDAIKKMTECLLI